MKKTANFLALLFLLVGCGKEIPDGGGDGNVNLKVGIDYGIEIVSKSSSSFAEISDDYAIEILDKESIVITKGSYSNYKEPFQLPAYEDYLITAESLSEESMLTQNDGRGSLRFSGSSQFDVRMGDKTDISFNCTVANSRVSVDYTDDFKTMFKDATVTISEKSSPQRAIVYDYNSTSEGNWGYFNIDADPEVSITVNATLNGGNTREYTETLVIKKATWHKLSINSTFVGGEGSLNITVDSEAIVSETELGVTPFEILELTLPSQNDYDVWATDFYPTQLTLADINDVDNKDIILSNIIYEVSSDATASEVANAGSGGTWTVAKIVDGKMQFSSLLPSTTYCLRARYYNVVSNSWSFTTEAAAQVGNAGFEDWISQKVKQQASVSSSEVLIYHPYLSDGGYDKWWDTNNLQTTQKFSNPLEWDLKAFPAVAYTTGRTGANAAYLYAMAYGGSTGASKGTSTPGKMIIGSFNSNGSVNSEGHSFSSRPKSLKFYYKYDVYESTSFIAEIKVLNGTEVIGSGQFTGSAAKSDWTEATANIDYSVTNKKATAIYIRLQSTTTENPPVRKADIVVPEGSSHIWKGSVLTVDDLNLNY